MISGISTAVFDLDGTLIDSLPDMAESGAELMHSYGLREPSAAEVRPMIGDGVTRLVERLLASDQHGSHVDPIEATKRFLTIYEPRATEKTRLFPHIRETLEALTRSGITCVICTNKPERPATEIVEHLDVGRFIATIGGGDSFGVRKPDPAHIARTIERIGRPIRHAVMIGDHRNDIRAAHSLPIPAIFASWGYGTPDMAEGADAIANQAAELQELIRA